MKRKVSILILICGLLIICTGCTTKPSTEQGYELQEKTITGTIDHVESNVVGQYYVYLNDTKILQFDIAERTIDGGLSLIIVNDSQLRIFDYLEKGDTCQWKIERYINVYYPHKDTAWKLIDFIITKKS
jgi:hypothetical protein